MKQVCMVAKFSCALKSPWSHSEGGGLNQRRVNYCKTLKAGSWGQINREGRAYHRNEVMVISTLASNLLVSILGIVAFEVHRDRDLT